VSKFSKKKDPENFKKKDPENFKKKDPENFPISKIIFP
jgi:hypothetical protein